VYFNDNNNGTNIDSEFNNDVKKKKLIFSKKWVILIVIIGLIILFVGYLFFNRAKTEYFLKLNGLSDIVVYQYDVYVDSGYMAYDNKGNNYNDDVIVVGEVNTEITGEYQIKYQYRDKEIIRTVTVLPIEDETIFLILNGEMTLFLNVGDDYKEPGYIVLDSANKVSNDDVVVDGKVDTSKPGTYKLMYTLKKNNSVLVEERTVIVMGNDVNVSYSPTSYTKEKVVINLISKDNYFDYVLLPDGTKNKERNIKYEVGKNGTYKFKIYLKNGNYREESVIIKNIDKEKPVGSCSGYYLENKSYVKVNAKDSDSGISKYIVDGKEFNSSTITLNAEMKNINITLYDKVGNSNSISCQLEDKNPITNRCNDKTIYPGHKYVFTDEQRKKMAAMVSAEADGDPKKAEDYLGMKLVASHMCNYYEKLYPNEDWSGKRLHWLITISNWYAEMTKKSEYNPNNERHQLALRAVEEVMEKGNRVLPHYIDEFDMFPEDVKKPLSNIDNYIKDETIYYGVGWIKVTFWCINIGPDGKSGNIFGYIKK